LESRQSFDEVSRVKPHFGTVARKRKNPHHPVFREWTGRESCSGMGFQPPMRRVMKNMIGIEQGNQDLDVQEGPHDYRASSSIKRRTCSVVTISPRLQSIATPFRVFFSPPPSAAVVALNPARSNSEITAPALRSSRLATSLASWRTSGSISNVVPMHQMRVSKHHVVETSGFKRTNFPAILRAMVKQRSGRIINIGSVSGIQAIPRTFRVGMLVPEGTGSRLRGQPSFRERHPWWQRTSWRGRACRPRRARRCRPFSGSRSS